MKPFRFQIFFSLMIVMASPSAKAQLATPLGPPNETSDTGQIWMSNLAQEPVGPGDLIYLYVAGAPEFSHSYRLSPEGLLSIPLLKSGINAAGMSPTVLAAAVTEAFVHERILAAPIVSAAVLEYRSRRVDVVGAVKAPVVLQAIGNLKLLDAITRAQGFAPEAGPEVIVTQPASDGRDVRTVHIPVADLLAAKDPALNLPLHGGEEIRVPEAPKVFVVGNVKMPGSYPLHDAAVSSVLRALASSQGTLSFTAKTAYVYRATDDSKGRREIPVPLRAILRRKAPDFELQANDILYVPENSKLHLNAVVLQEIATFGGSAGAALLYRLP